MANRQSVEDLLDRLIRTKAFIIASKNIKPPFDDGPQRYKDASLYCPRGDLVSIWCPPQERSASMESFIRECEKVMNLYQSHWIKHPCIVDVYGVSCIKNQPCLVMEHIDAPLSHLLQTSRPPSQPLNIEEILHIAIDIANGLRYLHSLQIVHCALCPENIIVMGWDKIRGRVKRTKIANLSRASIEHSPWITPSQTGSLLQYVPQEYHHNNTLSCDKRIDMYSFGVILKEIVEKMCPQSRTPQCERIREVAAVTGVGDETMTADRAFYLLCEKLSGDSESLCRSEDFNCSLGSNKLAFNLTEKSGVNPIDHEKVASHPNQNSVPPDKSPTEPEEPPDEPPRPGVFRRGFTAVVKFLRPSDVESELGKGFTHDIT